MRRLHGPGATLIAMGVSLSTTASTLAFAHAPSTHASVWIQPNRVSIGRSARMHAVHVGKSTYYSLLLAVPDLHHRGVEALFGSIHSDSRGRINTLIRLPIVTKCGHATVYLSPIHKGTSFHTAITLKGCKASGNQVPPPLPPSSPGKKQKP